MKHRDIYLSVLGILIIMVTTIGLSYAFLSAQGVSGNDDTNRVSTTVAKYGNLKVTYHQTSGVISLGAIDLPESTAGTHVYGVMKFKVSSENMSAGTTTAYSIKWAGASRVTNTFCQYANTTTYECVDPATSGTDVAFVGGDITYRLYSCSTESYYNSASAGSLTGCTALISETAAPATEIARSANIVTDQSMTSETTNYYVMIVTVYNKTTPQDYDQGKTFVGAITIVGNNN